jgi:hypothetical protein
MTTKTSGMESEYFARHKVPSYFSKIDHGDQNESDGTYPSNHDPSQGGTGDGPQPRPLRSSLSFSKKYLGRLDADASAGGNSESNSNMMSRVNSIKSILSVSSIANMTNGAAPLASGASDRNLTMREKEQGLRSPSFRGSFKSSTKLSFVSSSVRPNTTYITNNHAIMTPSGAGSKSAITSLQSLDYNILNDLNFDELELNLPRDDMEDNQEVKPTWRLKERMKTVGVGLILALNIGTDPPDVNKPTPCAKLQCWMDPSSTSRAKAREKIGELLEAQYTRWQGQQRTRMRYKRALDPTVEDVRNMCNSLRRYTKNERVLLHYNGSGVPRPTANGEIWLFDKNHTQYIPFSVTNLKNLVGKPSLVVLDCSGAGACLPDLTKSDDGSPMEDNPVASVKDVIVLCPCSESETLPTNPELPADLFTSCLTTPIAIALRWFIRQNPISCETIDPDSVDNIPGKLSDRKTPLGELNWIFTAITDTIAWNVLPTSLFQSLFRQDLMLASMFRNFLLADRILRELNCTPMSYPNLPTTCNHPLWQAWDLAVETCLSQLCRQGLFENVLHPHAHQTNNADNDSDNEDDSNERKTDTNRGQGTFPPNMSAKTPADDEGSENTAKYKYSISAPFFAEQLTAFDSWLEYSANRIKAGGIILSPPIKQHENFMGIHRMASFMYPGMSQNIESPEQLPIVLQVLLSPAHRIRALVLLRRFLYLGPSAVNLALSVGICPYVLRLLQSHIDEYKHILVGIWSKILEFDPDCKNDLVKDGALPHFIRHLYWGSQPTEDEVLAATDGATEYEREDDPALQRTTAAVILSAICSDESLGETESLFTLGQTECLRRNLHGTIGSILKSIDSDPFSIGAPFDFRMWLCICLGVLCKDNITAQNEVFKAEIHLELCARLQDESSDVRAAACFALGRLISFSDSKNGNTCSDGGPQILPSQGGQGVAHFLPMKNQRGSTSLPWKQQPFVPLPAHQLGTIPATAQNLIPQLGPQNSGPFQPSLPSEFSDHVGLDQDLLIVKSILGASDDASPIVRYEATVVLGRLVRKYLTAFITLAKSFQDNINQSDETVAAQTGFSAAIGDVLVATWKKIRFLHENDPHSKVASANTAILRFVNEIILNTHRQSGIDHENASQSDLVNTQENNGTTSLLQQRTVSAMDLNSEMKTQPNFDLSPMRESNLMSIAEHDRGPQRCKTVGTTMGLTRSITAGGHSQNQSNATFLFTKDPLANQNRQSPSQKIPALKMDDQTSSQKIPALKIQMDDPNLPVSKFYERQKEIFKENSGRQSVRPAMDPLCSNDAILLHREQRNLKIDSKTKMLSKKFALLRPLPKKRKNVLDVETDEATEAELTMEAELASNKKSLNLKEKTHLSYDGTKMTHMLRFHAYESVLAASDGANNVSVWDIKNPDHKIKNISNGNASNVKMTSMSWMNERNHTLLLTGCDDGSLRIWDNVLDSKYGSSHTEPVLATAFFALPELKSSQSTHSRGSGLVTEWQQSEGILIAGGNTPVIRCWDMTTEKCKSEIDSGIKDTCATSFVTAWDYVQNDSTSGGFSGLGPEIIVGGYGDGRIKIFDLRMHGKQKAASAMMERPKILRRDRFHKDHLHKNWIANLSYTHSPNKYEVRMKTSISARVL